MINPWVSLSNLIQLSYWILLVMFMVDMIKIKINGKNREILDAIIRYTLVFAFVYGAPYLFDIVKKLF